MNKDDIRFLADFLSLLHEYKDRVSEESMATIIYTMLERMSVNSEKITT